MIVNRVWICIHNFWLRCVWKENDFCVWWAKAHKNTNTHIHIKWERNKNKRLMSWLHEGFILYLSESRRSKYSNWRLLEKMRLVICNLINAYVAWCSSQARLNWKSNKFIKRHWQAWIDANLAEIVVRLQSLHFISVFISFLHCLISRSTLASVPSSSPAGVTVNSIAC